MPHPHIPSVVFDLDGTLVDSEPHYFEAGRQTLARHGATLTWEEHQRFVGIGTRETLAHLKARYGLAAPLDELLAEKNRDYLRLAAAGTRVFPQMRVLVERLRTAGVPMAVASGSSRAAIEAVLEGTGLAPLLPVTVSAEEVARGKPAPDVFLAAAHRLGTAPDRCVVVEDAAPGVAAAHAAGMRCVAVPYVGGAAGAGPGGDDPAGPGTGTDPGADVFARAELLFPGGQDEFTADAAWAWLTGTAT
ncbi:HAD family hydrolase [Streptomyces sp. NPDC058045]|uniref:HAD family hydrolase n=1 Tax=Streptomyces sp. NPDC058045 TaxID=3346311 RepID=UPI0036EFF110